MWHQDGSSAYPRHGLLALILPIACLLSFQVDAVCSYTDCKYAEVSLQCKSCTLYGGQAHCKNGIYCDACAHNCMTALQQESENLSDQFTKNSKSKQAEHGACAASEDTLKGDSYVLYSDKVLEEMNPYGLAVSSQLLEELAEADPFAAYIVGRRMYRQGGLIISHNLHQDFRTSNYELVSVSGIAEANRDSSEIEWDWRELPAEVRQLQSFRTDFSGERPLIVIETISADVQYQVLTDRKQTTLYLSQEPVYEERVLRTDDFFAPVYQVEFFETESLAPVETIHPLERDIP